MWVLYMFLVMFAIAVVAGCWGMAYGWYRGEQEARSYYRQEDT
jgi:phage-related minor tail protein